MLSHWATKSLPTDSDAVAEDGSEIRKLLNMGGGSVPARTWLRAAKRSPVRRTQALTYSWFNSCRRGLSDKRAVLRRSVDRTGWTPRPSDASRTPPMHTRNLTLGYTEDR